MVLEPIYFNGLLYEIRCFAFMILESLRTHLFQRAIVQRRFIYVTKSKVLEPIYFNGLLYLYYTTYCVICQRISLFILKLFFHF